MAPGTGTRASALETPISSRERKARSGRAPFGRTPAFRGSANVGTVVLTSDASHFYHNVETRQRVQIIGILPEMLTAFETIDRFAGSAKLVVAGHDPQIADRFKPVEPGIIKIA